MLQASSLAHPSRPRVLSGWLMIVAGIVVLIVAVGGITRLTESGLSITQWKPISGIIPPLTEAAWQAEFARYKQIPEYTQINRGMTLAGFQAIFFWEYLHRMLGRVIGLAFLLPFAWFALTRRVPPRYTGRLAALFALIVLQGAIGWWMVASGLTERTDVSHFRLAVHLMTALFLLAGLVWTALDLRALADERLAAPARLRPVAWWALGLLFAQIMFGAFTAGLDAGYAFASWPLMGDALFPAGVALLEPLWRNAIDHPVVVQFIHRWLAFVAAAALGLLAARAWRIGARRTAVAIGGLVVPQIALGIGVLLSGVEIATAVAHQVNAALIVIAATFAAHAIGRVPR